MTGNPKPSPASMSGNQSPPPAPQTQFASLSPATRIFTPSAISHSAAAQSANAKGNAHSTLKTHPSLKTHPVPNMHQASNSHQAASTHELPQKGCDHAASVSTVQLANTSAPLQHFEVQQLNLCNPHSESHDEPSVPASGQLRAFSCSQDSGVESCSDTWTLSTPPSSDTCQHALTPIKQPSTCYDTQTLSPKLMALFAQSSSHSRLHKGDSSGGSKHC